jgi:hypothetical protein
MIQPGNDAFNLYERIIATGNLCYNALHQRARAEALDGPIKLAACAGSAALRRKYNSPMFKTWPKNNR